MNSITGGTDRAEIEIQENTLNREIYLALRQRVGWRTLSDKQADAALRASLLTVCAFQNGQPVGMGRLIGDGAVICYIQDLVIVPEAQHMGIGSLIIERLIAYARALNEPDTTMMLCLMCAKGREAFYQKHRFTARPTDSLGPGMIRYLDGNGENSGSSSQSENGGTAKP